MPTPQVWEIFHCNFLVFKVDYHKTEHLRCLTFDKKTIYRGFSFFNTNKEQGRSHEPDNSFFYWSHNTKSKTMMNKHKCYPHPLLDATCFQPGYFFLHLNQSYLQQKRTSRKKKYLNNNYPSSSLRVAVFYPMIASQVLNVAITCVLEQISSEERAQVERRKISFEGTWTLWYCTLIYTWRGRRR